MPNDPGNFNLTQDHQVFFAPQPINASEDIEDKILQGSAGALIPVRYWNNDAP